jgi:hypothetical protein
VLPRGEIIARMTGDFESKTGGKLAEDGLSPEEVREAEELEGPPTVSGAGFTPYRKGSPDTTPARFRVRGGDLGSRARP